MNAVINPKELTIDAIKENVWNALNYSISEKTPEAVLLEASEAITFLSSRLLKSRDDAVTRGDDAAAQDCYKHYLAVEARADIIKAYLNQADDQRFSNVLAKLNEEPAAPQVMKPEPKAAPKSLPDYVHPHSAYWYIKKGGIDVLNAGERIALAIDYKAWAQKYPDYAKRYNESDYCSYRQNMHARKLAKRCHTLSNHNG